MSNLICQGCVREYVFTCHPPEPSKCDRFEAKNPPNEPDAQSIIDAQVIINRVLASCAFDRPAMHNKDYVACRQSIAEMVQSRKTHEPEVIVVKRHGTGWMAFFKDRPKVWEYSNTKDAAVGALIWTYFMCYPGQWHTKVEIQP